MEKTLIIIKPDGVSQNLIGEILKRFEAAGLKIISARMTQADRQLAEKHYPADRTELWTGIGNKTLKNYKELGQDVQKLMGTSDPAEIGRMVRVWLLDYITEGPVLAAILEGENAVSKVREICGDTLPSNAAKGTIRGDYGTDSAVVANTEKRAIKNLIHASGTIEEAEYEIPLWFSSDEIHER